MEKVQDKISFHFKPNNVTSFRNYHHQQSPERHTNENEERFAVSPPNNARTPLLEPRRNVPTSPLLENRHPPPKPAQFKVPNSNTTRELLRNGAHRLKAIDNNLHVAPHTFLKKQANGTTTDMEIDIERIRKLSPSLPPSPSLSPVRVPSKKSSPNHTPPVAQDLDLFVQSYRQLQNDCEQYKLQLENYKRSLIEERSKVEQFKTNLMSNFSCFTELDMIRYQHTETRLKQWDEHSVLFQSVMTSIDRLIAQKNERPKPSTELEMCKSKLRHLYQLWSGQTYDGTWITRYKSVLTSLTEGIQQQRTDIKSLLSNTLQNQTTTFHHLQADIHMVSHELGNIRTSSNIEAVTIEAIKSESQLVTKKLHRVLTSLQDMDEMLLVESVNESSLKLKCEKLERENEGLKREMERNEKSYLTDMKLLEDENQNILTQLKEAQTPPKRRRLRKLPAV